MRLSPKALLCCRMLSFKTQKPIALGLTLQLAACVAQGEKPDCNTIDAGPECAPADNNPPSNDNKSPLCVSDTQFFAQDIWTPILSDCRTCHNTAGEARASNFLLKGPSEADFLAANFEATKNIAAFELRGQSVLLLKPTESIAHGGGKRFTEDGAEFAKFTELLERFSNPVVCQGPPKTAAILDELTLFEGPELLRKVSLELVGRLPTETEYAMLEDQEVSSLEAPVNAMMEETAFLDRVAEIYGDLLLTDRYLRNGGALDLLSSGDYPDRDWFLSARGTRMREALITKTNRAVAKEPLELIKYVVRRNRPFTEILTANFIMVNPFSARTWTVSSDHVYVDGTDPESYDETDYRPYQLRGVPHAGLLTSHMFLNRFPTTDTNANRHRAWIVYKFFLATDILALSERPVDPTEIQTHNPTMNHEACTVCHSVLDPVAGAFQNWTSTGRYRPPENGWRADLRPPGFEGRYVPVDDNRQSLQWLAQEIAEDDRFMTSVIHTMYTALTGAEPLKTPTEQTDPAKRPAAQRAFETQNEVFQGIQKRFAEENYNLKTVVRMLIQTPYVRAKNAHIEPTEEQPLSELGGIRLLTPEQLHRKISAVLGMPWSRPVSDDVRDILISLNEFRVFYGGLDFETVTTRLTQPNGLMVNIIERMANELSCIGVSQDFTKPREQRLLFPYVEPEFQPETSYGFLVPDAVEAIEMNIRHLHRLILGSEPDEEERTRSYRLFYETYKEGVELLKDPSVTTLLISSCQSQGARGTDRQLLPGHRDITRDPAYIIRAWRAVISYLLSDWAFIYG